MRAESSMTAFAFRRGFGPGIFLALACTVLVAAPDIAFAASPAPVSAAGGVVLVHLDQAKIVKLPERTATLVIGNPLIADAVVQPGGIAVLTAKSYGSTNLIAVDRNGEILSDSPILVVGPSDQVVVVYRGIERETYSCVPNCERRITIGDSAGYFNANLGQFGAFSVQARGQTAPR
jgi:Flp pilus assembly secretin CpaC